MRKYREYMDLSERMNPGICILTDNRILREFGGHYKNEV